MEFLVLQSFWEGSKVTPVSVGIPQDQVRVGITGLVSVRHSWTNLEWSKFYLCVQLFLERHTYVSVSKMKLTSEKWGRQRRCGKSLIIWRDVNEYSFIFMCIFLMTYTFVWFYVEYCVKKEPDITNAILRTEQVERMVDNLEKTFTVYTFILVGKCFKVT